MALRPTDFKSGVYTDFTIEARLYYASRLLGFCPSRLVAINLRHLLSQTERSRLSIEIHPDIPKGKQE